MSAYSGIDYNTIVGGGFDLDPSFTEITNPFVIVAQHVLRRWCLEPGQLDVAFIGAGLNRALNANMSTDDKDELSARLRSMAFTVDGLQDIALDPLVISDAGELLISAVITLVDGDSFPTIFALSTTNIKLIVDGQVI